MSRTHHFDRLWQEAYDRERPILQEAARLRAHGVNLPLVELFRLASAFVDSAARLQATVSVADRDALRRHAERRMLQLLKEACPTCPM